MRRWLRGLVGRPGTGEHHGDLDQLLEEIFPCVRAGRLAVFCGAGISLSAGVPIVASIVSAIFDALRLDEADRRALTAAALPFEALVQAVTWATETSEGMVDLFRLGSPGLHHRFLARLARRGWLPTVCTTNLDTLLEQAYEEEGLRPGRDFDLVFRPRELEALPAAGGRPRLIKLHGSVAEPPTMAMTLMTVSTPLLTEGRRRVVEEVFATGDHDRVLVAGYSCSDHFDVTPQLQSIESGWKEVVFLQHLSRERGGRRPFANEPLSAQEVRNPFRHFGHGRRWFVDTDEVVRALWRRCLGEDPVEVAPPAAEWPPCIERWMTAARLEQPEVRARAASRLFRAAGHPGRALARLQTARPAVEASGDRDALCRLLLELADAHAQTGTAREGLESLAAVEATAEPSDATLAREILRVRAALLISQGIYEPARRALDEWSERDLDPYLRAILLHDLAMLCRRTGRFDEAREHFAVAIERFEAFGDKLNHGRALGDLGNLEANLGRSDRALAAFRASLEIARAVGDRHGQGVRMANIAAQLTQRGDFESAQTLLEQSIEVARDTGSRAGEGSRIGSLATLWFGTGRYAEALDGFQQALAVARELGDLDRELRWRTNLGITLAALGRRRQAAHELAAVQKRLAAMIGGGHPRTRWVDQLAALLDRGDVDALIALAHPVRPPVGPGSD